jgi:hypothetical protein
MAKKKTVKIKVRGGAKAKLGFVRKALKKIARKAKPAIEQAVRTAAMNRSDGALALSMSVMKPVKAPYVDDAWLASWIKPGRYTCRNGTTAIVERPITVSFGVEHRQKWYGWQGQIETKKRDGQFVLHVGEKLSWGLDGKRSDAAAHHEHDLVSRHKNQTIKAATPGVCMGCGCTDDHACPGGCSWVAESWCSACDERHK